MQDTQGEPLACRLLHYSEAVRCMLFSPCMQSRSLQQYEDNPLSVCVCQDTDLPWFLSAVFTAASVTDSKMRIYQLHLQ